MSTFPALTHVALTVRDLSVSVPWYGALFGSDPVIDEDTDPHMHHTVYLLGGGTLIGLHQHQTPAPSGDFSEYRVGLDHLAFHVRDNPALEAWAAHLDALGVEHSGIQDPERTTGGPLIVLRDPDNIQLELTAGWQPSP